MSIESNGEQEKEKVQDMLKNEIDNLNFKIKLRQCNTNIKYPNDSFFQSKTSNMRRASAFVRKIKSFSESNYDNIMKDLEDINLTRYVDEVANSIIESKIKVTEVKLMLEFCSKFHQIYKQFGTLLFSYWKKLFQSYNDDKITRKLKLDLKLYLDLIIINILPTNDGLRALYGMLNHLIISDTEDFANLKIVVKYLKLSSYDLLSYLPKSFENQLTHFNLEISKNNLIPDEYHEKFRSLLLEYQTLIIGKCKRNYRSINQTKQTNTSILMAKGEVSKEREERLCLIKDNFEKLHELLLQYSDLCGFDVLEFKAIDIEEAMNEPTDLQEHEMSEADKLGLFDDLESKDFYTQLLDLKAILPGICYKDIEEQNIEIKEENESDSEVTVDNIELELEELEPEDPNELLETTDLEVQTNQELIVDDTTKKITDIEVTTKFTSFEQFLITLPNCVNQDLIDKAAQEFCENYNTKHNRLRLAKELSNVPRSRLDLLPFYGRLVANIHQITVEVGKELIRLLSGDLRYQIRQFMLQHLETKIKLVRFLGELVKFSVMSKVDGLSVIKLLLLNRQQKSIDMHRFEILCVFIETCGRFLYRSPNSHRRMDAYLQIMAKRRVFLYTHPHLITMLDNAIIYCNPPDTSAMPIYQQESLEPWQIFLRKLLHYDINKLTVDKIFRLVRKFNWKDPAVLKFGIRCFTEIWNVKYSNVHCLASILAGLAPYNQELVISVVENVIEMVRVGMENNDPAENQNRICVIRYLGNLYVYKLVSSSIIFNILYSLLTFAANNQELDPEDSFFRIKLIHNLLDSCGEYFKEGSTAKKLDVYFLYLQRYFLYKRYQEKEIERKQLADIKEQSETVNEVSKDKVIEETDKDMKTNETKETKKLMHEILIQNQLYDLMKSLRPKCRTFKTYEECRDALDKFETDMRKRLEKKNIRLNFDNVPEEEKSREGLTVIREDDENDDIDDNGQETPEKFLSDDESVNPMEDINSENGEDNENEDPESTRKESSRMPRYIPCADDVEFQKEIEKMMQGAGPRVAINKKILSSDISYRVPDWTMCAENICEMKNLSPDQQPEHYTYALMIKKNGKNDFRKLEVPRESPFIDNLVDNYQELQSQKKEMISKTLLADEMQRNEETVYDQRPFERNNNHERYRNLVGKAITSVAEETRIIQNNRRK